MTDTEILTKAIEKAVKNGYKGFNLDGEKIIKEVIVDEINTTREYHPLSIKVRLVLIGTTISYYLGLYELIFSHSFAKAFWGMDAVECGDGLTEVEYQKFIDDLPEERRSRIRKWGIDGVRRRWRYHLQQMVLEENPISYIGRFL